MSESLTIRRDNPLFIRYGSLVERCFTANGPVGVPLTLFPAVGRSTRTEGGNKKALEHYADPDEVAAAQKTVDKLRAALLAEARDQQGGQHRTVPSTTRQWHDFRLGLQRGQEAMLEENPFYELAGLFYRINLTALKNALTLTQQEAAGNLPRPITVSRSYRHIWSSDSAVTTLRQKWWETFGKIGSLGKLIVGLILFAGSTITTAKGVVDLVQLPEFVALFGDGLSGPAHESVRTLFALIVGFSLSSIILDYKSHLFRGAAEAGQVFRGFYHAWRHHPRWVIIAAFLTMISIWTNYDGIVLLISKTEDLTHQWKKIEQQVNSAMGDTRQPDTDQPGSLRDLHATLHKKAAAAIAQFKKVPEDELSGAASSGVASAGPRYWAKQFIIEGGYQPGRHDVAKAYKSTALVGQIDAMLKRSGLDLHPSLAEKINRILTEYESAFRQSEAAVQAKMAALSGRMTLKNYSLDELTTLFNLESYHVNEGVQGIVAHLEENKNAFAKAARELNQLAESHIALLREVDKIGTPVNNTYTIVIQIGIPELAAIDRLKQGGIPMAKRRNLVELKEIMLERYGVFLGGVFLFLILFLAIFMDLSDPILYTAMVARWGRRDRQFLDENVKRLQEWEEEYIRTLHRLLVRSDVLALLPRLPTPKIYLFHHLYNRFLEEVEPRVKDPSTWGWWEKTRFWFLGLFSESRIEYVEGYNARQTALLKCVRDARSCAPRALNTVFPGLLEPVRIGVDRFDAVFTRIHARMKQNELAFEQALARHAPVPVTTGAGADTDRSDDRSGRRPTGGLLSALLALRSVLYWLFWKPVDPPHPTFPLTRINQVRALALARHTSRSHISHLVEFVPDLRHFLRDRLFVIKKELLHPLTDALARIPNGEMIVRSFRIHALQTEYAQLEQGLLEILGLSQFQGIPISAQTMQTIVAESGVDELAGIFLRRDTRPHVLEQRIDKLAFRLARAYKLIRDLVEGQDTLIFTLTRIRREYLGPINTALGPLQTRSRIEEALGLHKMKADLAIIEKCLLELWDASVQPIGVEPDAGGAGLGAIIDLIRRNSARGQEFDLVAYVRQLEGRMADIYQRLDTAIHQLSMVDRITTNALMLLDQALALVQDIFIRDDALQAFPPSRRITEQKKFDFLEENRLFFRTVSLQVSGLQARLNSLDMGACLLGFHGMDLARDLEKQAIMLRYFLKNALDFLDDKRDGIGLTAALAELKPRVRPVALAQEQGAAAVMDGVPTAGGAFVEAAAPEPVVASTTALAGAGASPSAAATVTAVTPVSAEAPTAPEAETAPAAAMASAAPGESPDALADQIRATCIQARQVLLEMSLREWDLLKNPIPPPDLLHIIQMQQPVAAQACLAVEGVLVTLEGVTRWQGGQLEDTPGQLATLQTLQQQASEALEQLHGLLDQISLPAHVDRRSKVAVMRFLKQQAEQRQTAGQASQRLEEDSSRRVSERVVVRSRVAVQVLDGGPTITGVTRDLNARGICLEADQPPTDLTSGLPVHLQLLSDPARHLFPGQLFRTSGTLLVILLDAGSETQFLTLIRGEILRDRDEGAGILHLQPSSVFEAHPATPSDRPTAEQAESAATAPRPPA
ncbi:MAG: hypothetical protein H7838_06745 [Magnetococcus sp. DMHC-8]